MYISKYKLETLKNINTVVLVVKTDRNNKSNFKIWQLSFGGSGVQQPNAFKKY